MELFPRACTSEATRRLLVSADPHELFPGARDPESALSGLFLYFSCLKEAHDLLHLDLGSPDGGYWHAIMHRMEGDAFNADYWFRYIGRHPLFPALAREAAKIGYLPGADWDPFAFVRYCGASAKANDDDLARRVQLVEWQLLFDYCAAPSAAAAGRIMTSRVAAR
jgi:hypothetical protein